MGKTDIGKLLWTGLKVWIVLMLAGLIMAIPYALVMFAMTKAFGLGVILAIVALLLYLIVIGWVIIKFKSFIFK